jgi:2-polyprenyl-3-methyl-5-hydroxy-6-metoxy-1,4-benzoquinol methylase
MLADMRCNICGAQAGEGVETALVRSNVRKWSGEKFAVWRCPSCLSIHARDEVDLAHYYADYPFHKLKDTVSWMLDAMYRKQLSFLEAAGISAENSLLDFGCGSGMFLTYVKKAGFAQAFGYDEYSEDFTDKSVLSRSYDCVIAQDVLEHVPDPLAFVRTLHELTRPGGVVALGTPNAEAIDLQNPEARVHTLHQPYHRHIFSKRALQTLAKDLGWELLHYYPDNYANTPLPGANFAFIDYYFKLYDNNCDLSVEPIKVSNWKIWSPLTLWHMLFGYFYPPECDVMAVFRRG